MDKNTRYLKVANDIWEALCKTRFSGEERQVLDVVMRKTWGFNKKQDSISLSQFMKATGIEKKPNIVRAIKKLEAKNVLIVIKKDNDIGNLYSLNKHFKLWRPLSKKITVIKKDNESLSKMIPTKDNRQKTNSSKEELVPKTKKAPDPLVGFVLEEFRTRTGSKPTDKQPRRVAWNLIQLARTLIKQVRPHFPKEREQELTEKAVISRGLEWYFEHNSSVETTALDTVKRHLDARFFEATRKKYIPNYQLQQAKS